MKTVLPFMFNHLMRLILFSFVPLSIIQAVFKRGTLLGDGERGGVAAADDVSCLRERRPVFSFWKRGALSRHRLMPLGRLSCSSFQRTKGRWWKQEPLCLMFKQNGVSRLFLYEASSFFNLIVIRLVSEVHCAIPPRLFPLKSLFLLCKKRKKKWPILAFVHIILYEWHVLE